jgi:hypothetical protein
VATLGADTLHFGCFADQINLKTHKAVSLTMPTNTRIFNSLICITRCKLSLYSTFIPEADKMAVRQGPPDFAVAGYTGDSSACTFLSELNVSGHVRNYQLK